MVNLPLSLHSATTYGSIPANFNFKLEYGYQAFVGKNNSGKSSLLQWIFRQLYTTSEIPRDKYCLVTTNRNYVHPNSRVNTNLIYYNDELYKHINSEPLNHDDTRVYSFKDLFHILSQTDDMRDQQTRIDIYLARMGFDVTKTGSLQIITINGIPIEKHGAGLRSLL